MESAAENYAHKQEDWGPGHALGRAAPNSIRAVTRRPAKISAPCIHVYRGLGVMCLACTFGSLELQQTTRPARRCIMSYAGWDDWVVKIAKVKVHFASSNYHESQFFLTPKTKIVPPSSLKTGHLISIAVSLGGFSFFSFMFISAELKNHSKSKKHIKRKI
jgi:hypothetical protein